ncbi:MAG TPA: hypothetical protein VIE63_08545 [Ramlibacter sp.]
MRSVLVQAIGGANPHTAARVMAAALLLLWACDAIALDTEREASAPDATVVAGDFPRPALEVTTSTMPRFGTADGTTQASRVDLSVMPRQASGVGLSLGVTRYSAPAAGFAPYPQASQSLDLGLRWRYTLDSSHRFDVTAYRRMPESDAMSMIESRDPSYGARVEMALGGKGQLHRGFVAEHGFVGFQLESGARLTVKRSGGVPMLYYRNSF